MPEFSVVTGRTVARVLHGRELATIDRVRTAYLVHDQGDSINPPSMFLRFPDRPEARIIALPAYLGGAVGTSGMKWIASYPGNLTDGLPRASAVLVLNDAANGHPFALLEASAISAARTAASAALAAVTLGARRAGDRGGRPPTVGVVGCGLIARTICRYLAAAGVALDQVRCHDVDQRAAEVLAAHLNGTAGTTAEAAGLSATLDAELVVFATTAAVPYVPASTPLPAGRLWLNISLRDLHPELLSGADNILDDVEHCLTAGTSPHLAEQVTGNRDFVTGTLSDVLLGRVALDPGRATIFSPFGLGVLDIAVGHLVYEAAHRAGLVRPIADFYG